MRRYLDDGFSRASVLVVLLLVGLAGVLFWTWQRRGESTHAAFETVEVGRGTIVHSVLATGSLNPVRTVQVGSQISGNIMELLADFNSEVARGDVIARLDPAIHQANVSLAEAEKERAAAALELGRVQWERVDSLYERAMISEAERDEARARLRQVEADFLSARYELEKAQLELERCTILSPIDGIVISRDVDVGQTVAASLSAPVLFLIAEDLAQMEINTFVSEADIGQIREGQRAEFRVDAYRDARFEGEVWQVRHAPEVIDNVVSYDAVVRVANPDHRLKPGMTAEIDFITHEREAILRVRNAALRLRLPEHLLPASRPETGPGERLVVRQLPSGRLEAVSVRVGISDGSYTEIVEGLREGDVLVTGLSVGDAAETRTGLSLLQGRQDTF